MKGKLLEGREEFEQLCARLCSDRSRAAEINGVFLAEIDNYRELGSRYGMEGQDRMVGETEERLRQFLEDDMAAARFGDAMFLLSAHGLPNTSAIEETGKRLKAALAGETPGGEPLTVSVGAARCLHDREQGYRCAFDLAYKALHKAETGGGNQVVTMLDGRYRGEKKTRVLIVEDQEMVRQRFEQLIADSERYELVYSIRNAALADLYCQKNRIDLILMDVYTAFGSSGLEAAARIKKRFPGIRIIIVTSLPEYSYLERAREAGVDSFWYKEMEGEPILTLMDRTMRGESVYPDRSPEVMIGEASSYDFSRRELEILKELTSGDTNEEIADRLHLSPFTVKSHIGKLLAKTGLKSRTELAIRARESGLVILDPDE